MKNKREELLEKANELIRVAKRKNNIKSHTKAFEDFPVEKEIHKGKKEYYLKIN